MEQPAEASATPSSLQAPAPEDFHTPTMFALRGRIGRLRYLAFSSTVYLLGFCYGAFCIYTSFDEVSNGASQNMASQAMVMVLGAVFFLLQAGAQVVFAWRRFEDIGHSGWLGLLTLVPVVSLPVGLYLIFCPGNAGRNQFGPAPTANTPNIYIAGIGLPIALILAILAFIGFILATFMTGIR